MKKLTSYISVIAALMLVFSPTEAHAQVFIFDETDGFTNEEIWELDADNTGVGVDLEIRTNQGSENDGVLRYNSTTNQWELSNDGVSYNSIATGSASGNTLDNAYDQGGAGAGRTINVDSGPVTLSGTGNVLTVGDGTANDVSVTFDEDGADGSITWDNANDEFDFDSDIDVTGNLSASASASVGTNLDIGGDVGIGIASPAFDLHLFDNTSAVASEWIGFDDGTNQVSILTGTQDPTTVATDADTGSIFLNTSTGSLYIKTDDGSTTNWDQNGFDVGLLDALEGTFGTPSSTNKFVTDTDPRLSQTSGGFGEVALGTRLDYTLERIIARDVIFYTRVFFPSDTTIISVGVFTTNSRTGNINMAIYSDDNGPDSKLAETGTQTGVSSPINDFWKYDLSSSLEIDTAGYYWLALAMSVRPDGRVYDNAEDAFIPYRVESKSNGSTTLPATANPAAVGGNEDLPYIAAFE